jgi:hypothetical protein
MKTVIIRGWNSRRQCALKASMRPRDQRLRWRMNCPQLSGALVKSTAFSA